MILRKQEHSQLIKYSKNKVTVKTVTFLIDICIILVYNNTIINSKKERY